MFSKSVVATTLLALAAATAATMPASQCTTGPVQCCDSTTSSVTSVASLLGVLGIDPSTVAVPIGLTCTPITVVGVGSGATCSAQPVCCLNNSYNGVVALGCSPVDLNL